MTILLDVSKFTLNNDRPTEERAIRHSLSSAKQSLERVMTGRPTLLSLLQKSREEETKLVQAIAQHEAVLAPHRKLPHAVLHHIFTALVQGHGPALFPLRRNGIVPPQLVVSHVCSKWRKVALHMGELWTDVDISEIKEDQTADLRNRQIRDRWLSRAGDRPVKLGIDLGGLSEDAGYSVVRKLVLAFRVKRLNLQLTTKHFAKLGDLPPESLSELEDVMVKFTELDSELAFHDQPHFVGKTLSVGFNHKRVSDTGLLQLSVPWAMLCYLDCAKHPMTVKTGLQLLQQTPLLKTLCLCIDGNDACDADNSDAEKVTLLHLQELSLSFPCSLFPTNRQVSNTTGDVFLRSLECPTLDLFQLFSRHEWTTRTYDIIERGYNLRRLQAALFEGKTYPLKLSVILKDAPMLRELLISQDFILDDEAFAGISSTVLGRRLRKLTLDCTMDVDEMLRATEARQRNAKAINDRARSWKDEISMLKEVVIKDMDVNEEHTVQSHLDMLKGLGVNIVLEHKKVTDTLCIVSN